MKSNPPIFNNLSPIWLAAIYLGGNYLLVSLLQMVLQMGEMGFNICLAILVILTTKSMAFATGKSMDEFGWRPLNTQHWKQLLIGIFIGFIMLITTALVIKWHTGFSWQRVPFTITSACMLFISTIASAYFQELAFRGFPFQVLLKKYGTWPAQFIIAIAFGLMHIDRGMHLGEIFSIMFTTGIGSFLFGWAYIRTKNLALPIGIHFGWNYLQTLLPRHPSQNGKGFVKIMDGSFDSSHLNTFTWLYPYLIVVIIATFLISYLYKERAYIYKQTWTCL